MPAPPAPPAPTPNATPSTSPPLRSPFARRALRLVALGLDGALQLSLGLLAAGALVLVAGILWSRWDFPAEIEWMEGGSLAHVARIANGDPLYVAPSPDWVPYIYHPFYYYACWVASWFFGLGLPAMRFVSILGFAATLGGLAKLTFDTTGSRVAALTAPAFYAATFELGGNWFDIARVDGFVQGLFTLGVVAIRGRSRKAQMVAVLLFYFCFMSKQLSIVMFAPVVLWALVHRGREAWNAAVALTIVSGLSVLYMHLTTDGWYWYYCIELPGSHPLVDAMWKDFWRLDLRLVWPALGACTLLLGWLVQKPRKLPALWLVLGVLFGGVATGLFSRVHAGGFLNVLLPTFGALALGLGYVLGHAQRIRRPLGWALLALCIWQLHLLEFTAERHVMTDADREAAEEVRAAIAEIDGEVYAPESASYTLALGHPPRPHAVAVEDILRGGPPGPREAYLEALREVIADERYGGLLLNDLNIAGSTLDILTRGYRVDRGVLGPYTRTGMWTRVHRIYVPR